MVSPGSFCFPVPLPSSSGQPRVQQESEVQLLLFCWRGKAAPCAGQSAGVRAALRLPGAAGQVLLGRSGTGHPAPQTLCHLPKAPCSSDPAGCRRKGSSSFSSLLFAFPRVKKMCVHPRVCLTGKDCTTSEDLPLSPLIPVF